MCKSPSGDGGHSGPPSPNIPMIKGRRCLHAPPPTEYRYETPSDNRATSEPRVGAGRSLNTSPTLAATNETAKTLEPYLASIDNTLKGLGPCLAQINVLAPHLEGVTRMLERMECYDRLDRQGQLDRRPAPVERPLPQPRPVPTPMPRAKQQTKTRHIRGTGEAVTYREQGVQTMPLSAPPGEARGAEQSATPHSEVATPREQSPETVNYGSTSEADEPPRGPTEDKRPSSPAVTNGVPRVKVPRVKGTANSPRVDTRRSAPR